MQIERLTLGDTDRVMAAGALFDGAPRRDWSLDFLRRDGHHLLFAEVQGVDVGFVSGIEVAHPDKGVEMLLYELGVDEPFRRRGIGQALVLALSDLARERGCRGMWVPTDADDWVAHAVYRSAGADEPEAGAILEWRFD